MYADLIAGCIAGSSGVVVGHPLDTLKTRLQCSRNYRGFADCLRQSLKTENALGLYRGMFAPLASAGLLHALLFAGYGATLKLLHRNDANTFDSRKELPIGEVMLASAVGATLQLIPAIPVEVLKTNLQVVNSLPQVTLTTSGTAVISYTGPVNCARSLIATNGVSALYKGGTVMFFRDSIGFTFYIPIYEVLYRRLKRSSVGEVSSQLLAGGIAGSLSWWTICPLEVLKNRLQTRQNGVGSENPLNLVRDIYRREGFFAFWRGGMVMACRAFPVNAVIFLIYSKVLRALE
ncbi:Protein R07B7.10 [Aphelenchoides avenae]|nr:Protein R07B7.10 [Aphelenchus avenae]